MQRNTRLVLSSAFASLMVVGCDNPELGQSESATANEKPWFQESAQTAGLTFHHSFGNENQYWFPESIGAGCGLLDVDGDGDLDAFFAQGHDLGQPAGPESRNRLFLNDGTGSFVDATDQSGLIESAYTLGITAGDLDNDGDIDLYVSNLGPDVLYFNDGLGRFSKCSERDCPTENDFSSSSCLLDFDQDGDLDIYVCRYMEWSTDLDVECSNEIGGRDYCGPTRFGRTSHDRLLQNNGNGTFTDISQEAGLSQYRGRGLAVAAADLNDDGWLDLYVANDKSPNQLLINTKDGRFENQATELGCATGMDGGDRASMSVNFVDLDDDGDFDIHVSNIKGEADGLFINQNGQFFDRAAAWGIAGASRRKTRWSAQFLDFDVDGQEDLFVACGKVLRTAQPPRNDMPYAEVNLFYTRDDSGRFTVFENAMSQDVQPEATHGTAYGDVNGDGHPDLLMLSRQGPAQLWLRTPSVHTPSPVQFDLRTPFGAPAIGTSVFVTLPDGSTQRYQIDVSGGYASSNSHVLYVAGPVESIEIQWATGHRTSMDGPWTPGSIVKLNAPES